MTSQSSRFISLIKDDKEISIKKNIDRVMQLLNVLKVKSSTNDMKYLISLDLIDLSSNYQMGEK